MKPGRTFLLMKFPWPCTFWEDLVKRGSIFQGSIERTYYLIEASDFPDISRVVFGTLLVGVLLPAYSGDYPMSLLQTELLRCSCRDPTYPRRKLSKIESNH